MLLAHLAAGCVPEDWVTVSPRDAGVEAGAGDAPPGDAGGCEEAACDPGCVPGSTARYRAEDDARDEVAAQHATFAPGRYAAGRFGRAFSFEGARAPRYVEIPPTVGSFGEGDFTVALWFITTNRSSNSSLITRRAACWGVTGFAGHDLRVAYNGRLFLEVWTTRGAFSVGSAPGYNDGRWHHVAMVRAGPELHLAVDGSVVGTVAVEGSVTDPSRTPTYLGVGRCVVGAPGTNGAHDDTAWFEGRIDDVGYFDRAMSAGELSATAQERCAP